MCDTAGEAKTNLMTFFNGPLYIDVPVLADQQEVIWKTYRERWMIRTERERERESRKSMLSDWLNDEDDDVIEIYTWRNSDCYQSSLKGN